MKLTKIEGPAAVLHCAGCKREGIGGTETYVSAASGETRAPEDWYMPELDAYTPEEGPTTYCGECSAKLVEIDPTRSVNQFYSDTAGTEIAPENL